MRYNEEEKRTLVNLFPEAPFTLGFKPIGPSNPRTVPVPSLRKGFDSLLRRCEKQKQIIAVLKSIPAISDATTKEKLAILEPLYGQFSVHVLCERLDIPRGTFYNHIKRSKRGNSSYAKHREELREAIQDIFDESRQTFGSEKICAVLHERGYKAGTTLVRELMSEMGLSSVSTTSKRQRKKPTAMSGSLTFYSGNSMQRHRTASGSAMLPA